MVMATNLFRSTTSGSQLGHFLSPVLVLLCDLERVLYAHTEGFLPGTVPGRPYLVSRVFLGAERCDLRHLLSLGRHPPFQHLQLSSGGPHVRLQLRHTLTEHDGR